MLKTLDPRALDTAMAPKPCFATTMDATKFGSDVPTAPSVRPTTAELQALLKRIDARRKEHIKQRTLDSKRLLQRNRNVQSVLESKQAAESNATFMEIKKNLIQSTALDKSVTA